MKDRNCEDCGYCKEHLHFTYCNCTERKDIPISKDFDYGGAKTCKFYDDDSWTK